MANSSENNAATQSSGTAKERSYEIVESAVPQFNEPFVPYTRLDPAAHGRVIHEELTTEEEAMANDPNVKPFSQISDSADYVRRIRRDFKC